LGYRIEVRDRGLARIGEVDTWISLSFTVAFCQQGSWQLLIKAGTAQADLFVKGGGVAIYQDGVPDPVLTGQVETFQHYWTTDQHTGPGSLYIGGHCDNKLAYQRLALPDPGAPIGQQYAAPDTRLINEGAGAAIWNELNQALGPGAQTSRRVPGVALGGHVTSDAITDTLRYDVIGTKVEDWVSKSQVGYRFLYDPDAQAIVLNVFTPRDRSASVRFSTDLGNLREYTWTLTAPTATRAIVACQGEGAQRFVWQKTATDAEHEWNLQIETFLDRRDVPLQTGPDGSAELVTTTGADGIEDLGTDADGNDWTTDLTTARAAYDTAVTAVQAAHDAVNAATTDTQKTDANAQLVQATADQVHALATLDHAITAAKLVAVTYYMNVISDAADSVLTDGAPNGNFQVYPIDTPQMAFGRDYFVGDIVTVAVDGTEYSDVLRQVTVTVDDGGNTLDVAPVIGDQGTGNPLNLYSTVFKMREQLRKLEARM
jgi:hypothetical protein